MSALVDALCAPPSSGDPAALIYDTFNAASFFFDNAAAFYDSGIVTVTAPAPVHPNDVAGTAAAVDSTTTSLAPRRKRRRRAVRSCKSKEEAESQRMTHIAVERNRRRQMNEYLAALRSLMPEAYVQRRRTANTIEELREQFVQDMLSSRSTGDQASIVGGAIEFVKELEQQLQSLEAQKRTLVRDLHKEAKPEAVTPPKHAANAAAVVVATATPTCAAAAESATTTSNCSSSVTEDAPDALPPPFARFFTYPQYVWCHGQPRDCATTTAAAEDGGGEGRPGVADVEVTLVETHASVRVMAPRRPGQLLRMVSGLQALRLTTLHLTVTALDALALYTLSVKVEEGCCLTTVEDIAGAVHQVLCMIDADAATRHLLGVGAEGH